MICPSCELDLPITAFQKKSKSRNCTERKKVCAKCSKRAYDRVYHTDFPSTPREQEPGGYKFTERHARELALSERLISEGRDNITDQAWLDLCMAEVGPIAGLYSEGRPRARRRVRCA